MGCLQDLWEVRALEEGLSEPERLEETASVTRFVVIVQWLHASWLLQQCFVRYLGAYRRGRRVGRQERRMEKEWQGSSSMVWGTPVGGPAGHLWPVSDHRTSFYNHLSLAATVEHEYDRC